MPPPPLKSTARRTKAWGCYAPLALQIGLQTCDYMGNVSFADRFELLDPMRDDLSHQDQVQTFRARERATGRVLEAHLLVSSPDLLEGLEHLSESQRNSLIDRGSHDGKIYVVTTPLAGGFRAWLTAAPASLDSAGAWRIRLASQPEPPASPEPGSPGDFTRMFQLRQAPEPVSVPVSKPLPAPARASQPGAFTRVFERPAMASSATPTGDSPAGQPGEFTRLFQKPAPPVPVEQELLAPDRSVPVPPVPASQPRGILIAIAIVILFAIAVFVLMRTLY